MTQRPLRIYLCCQQDLRLHPVPAYRFWAKAFRSAFAEAGHVSLEAAGCDWAEGLVAKSRSEQAAWRERTWQRALEWIRTEHRRQPIDLFLSYLYPEQVHAGGLAELRATGIPSVNFFCDNIRLFRKIPAQFRGFDLHWVPEKAALDLYRRAGLATLYAPMPCWVAPRWRGPPAAEIYPPTFIGTSDEQRQRLFARAYQLGLKLELRGLGWTQGAGSGGGPPPGKGLRLLSHQWDFAARHGIKALLRKWSHKLRPPRSIVFDFQPWVRAPCPGDEYWQVLRGSRVAVGVNRYPSLRHPIDAPDCYSRLRDLEAPMAGAAYLTEYAPGLEDLYHFGEEIEVYRTAEELVEKVAELEQDEPKRNRLRRLGQRRALADHGIAQTVQKIAARVT